LGASQVLGQIVGRFAEKLDLKSLGEIEKSIIVQRGYVGELKRVQI
jgi:hypothetical protein